MRGLVYEYDGDYIPSSSLKVNMTMKSNPLTRSQAATVQKCPVRIPDIALKPQRGTITKGATGNPPKLTSATRVVARNDGFSSNKGKQPVEESTDEKTPDENQDLDPSTGSSSGHPTLGQLLRLQQLRNSTVPSSTELVQNIVPSTNKKKKNEAVEAHSFHLTEMAAMMDHGPSDDDEEVESSVDQTLISVGGYRVKKDIAPLLKQILDQHQEIAKECKIVNLKRRVPYLEMICSVCQNLKKTSLKDVTDTELEDTRITVEGIQFIGFDVKWLLGRLEDISKVKRLLKKYPAVKEKDAELDKQLKEIDMLEQQLSAAKANFSVEKMEADKVKHDLNQEITDLKAKGLVYWKESLLHGLITST